MVKLIDIARQLGLSVTTVSYSLNNDPRIPAATKQRVLDAAEKLGYRGRSGKPRGSGYLKQVVLCLNSLRGGVYTEIVEAMKDTLVLNNCDLMVYIGADVTRIKWMDGLFVLNSKVSNADIMKITSRNIPVILMDRETELDGAVSVTLDNFNGCKEATQCAVDAGAKTFAFIGGPKESFESGYRFNGFKSALAENGLNDKNTLVLQTDFTYDGGLNACRFVLEHTSLPDAVVCANDETAMGIIAGLKAGNVKKDIIVTGFDGVMEYDAPNRFVTAKADLAHWAASSSYSMLQLFEHITSTAAKKIPVKTVRYNI